MGNIRIKEAAVEILNNLKDGKGIEELFKDSSYRDDILQIIEVVTNECKAKVVQRDGTVKKYESDLSIDTVRNTIKQIISDRNSINPSVASRLMSTDRVIGILIEIPIEKETDAEGNLQLSYKKPFPNNFEEIIENSISDRNVIENIFFPRAVSIIENDEKLSKKHRTSKMMHPVKTRIITNEKLKKRYAKFLKKEYHLPPDQLKNMVNYFVLNFLNSAQIEQEVINTEKNGGFILPENKGQKGYLGMVENIVSDLVDIGGILKNPNNKLDEIKDIYGNLVGQLSALGISLNGVPEQIENKIKAINKNINRRGYNLETGYRKVPVTFGKKDVGLLREEHVPQAMRLFAQSVQEFQEKKEGMDDKEFIKEITKLHYRFIRIHPFRDGNGRTGRAIVNSLLSERNFCAVFDKNYKSEYIRCMDIPKEYMGEKEYKEYYEALYTDHKRASEIEEKYIYKIEEYLGIKCLDRGELYKDRDITMELPINDIRKAIAIEEQTAKTEINIPNVPKKREGLREKIIRIFSQIKNKTKNIKMLRASEEDKQNNFTSESSERTKFLADLKCYDCHNDNNNNNQGDNYHGNNYQGDNYQNHNGINQEESL